MPGDNISADQVGRASDLPFGHNLSACVINEDQVGLHHLSIFVLPEHQLHRSIKYFTKVACTNELDQKKYKIT